MRNSVMTRWVAIAALLSTHAIARTNAQTENRNSFQPSQTQNAIPTPSGDVVSPSAAGSPHICPAMQWYPRGAVATGESGITVLDYRIGTDGMPKDFSVAQSSGYSDLDDAAIKCASTWRYKPAMKDGTPVETSWSAKVNWSLDGRLHPGPGVETPPYSDRETHICGNPIGFSQLATTLLLLHIDESGSVNGADIITSSGNSELDEKARACETTNQHFTPATADGKPIKSNLEIHIYQQSPPAK